MAPEPDRRSFLQWIIIGLGGIFSVILGAPIVAYVIDPRHRKGPKSEMKLVEGVKLDELVKEQPQQGVIRAMRTDGWTLYPNDVIGRVWVVQLAETPAVLTGLTQQQKDAFLLVFTTICPHLGCSVNLAAATGIAFACPCHNATFALDGHRATESNPARRGMDTLEWDFDEADPNRIVVKYQNFATSIPEKKAG